LGFWLDAMVTSVMGELRLLTSGGIESVVLPLVARLHARGEVEAARRWVEWALEGAPSPALRCAEVALAFRIGDGAESESESMETMGSYQMGSLVRAATDSRIRGQVPQPCLCCQSAQYKRRQRLRLRSGRGLVGEGWDADRWAPAVALLCDGHSLGRAYV
jgi:hypothetical protein